MNTSLKRHPFIVSFSFAPFLVALGLLTVTGFVSAAETPAKTPAAREIMDRFVREIGGAEAFKKIESQHMKGKFEMGGQGITGNLEVFAKRPDKLLIKINMPGVGDLLQGFDGEVGWSLNPVTGPMVLEGKMLAQLKEQARFDAVLHAEGDLKSAKVEGITPFEGKDAYKVKVVRKSGQEAVEYYDVKSGLLVGSSEIQETPLGSIAATGMVSDYKKFGDVLFATRLTQKMGPLAQVMSFDSVEFNTVDDAVFELPEQIKALIKK